MSSISLVTSKSIELRPFKRYKTNDDKREALCIPLTSSPLKWNIPLTWSHFKRPCTKRFILYMQPHHDSALYKEMLNFYKLSKQLIGPNEAHQYHPHSSFTGFFSFQDAHFTEKEILSSIVTYFDEFFTHQTFLPVPTLTKIQRPSSNPSNLVISLDTPRSYYTLVENFKKFMSEKNVLIRLKPLDHLSLAYFKSFPDKALTEEQLLKHERLANRLISTPFESLLEWDLVLHEQVHKSPIIGRPHVFREIKRWRVG